MFLYISNIYTYIYTYVYKQAAAQHDYVAGAATLFAVCVPLTAAAQPDQGDRQDTCPVLQPDPCAKFIYAFHLGLHFAVGTHTDTPTHPHTPTATCWHGQALWSAFELMY